MTSENNITEELTKLAKLHADGALSDEEFKALKAKLISEVGRTDPGVSSPQTAARGATTKPISDWAAWCLALTPIIAIPINAIVIGHTESLVLPYIVPICLWLLFFFIDRDIIRKGGGEADPVFDPVSAAIPIALLALIFVPVYLYRRSERLGKSFSSFYACLAVMALSVLLSIGAQLH
jgi:hypothetical protein